MSLTRAAALLATLLFPVATPAAVPQQVPKPLVFGTPVVFHSAVLGEDRQLNVLLPAGYGAGDKAYPVIYLLDGAANEDWFHAASLFDFLETYGVMPATIVVGVANVDRQRDFTMPSSDPEDLKAAPTSGGAEKFIDFVERDLIPYVGVHYRVSDRRTIVGQSLAGLVATQILLERPHLFTDYVIVSPSLWWNKEAMLKRAAEALKAHPAAAAKLYLSLAKEGDEMQRADEAFVDQNPVAPPPDDSLLPVPARRDARDVAPHQSVQRDAPAEPAIGGPVMRSPSSRVGVAAACLNSATVHLDTLGEPGIDCRFT